MVASDRVSAFDVVMRQPVPRKGEVLTQITAWWLHRLAADLGVDHHLLAVDPDHIVELHPELAASREEWAGTQPCWSVGPLPILVECVIRGYLAGSAWREYEVSTERWPGEPLPTGLRESDEASPSPSSLRPPRPRRGTTRTSRSDAVRGDRGRVHGRTPRDLSFRIYEYGRRHVRRPDAASSWPTPSSSSASTPRGGTLLLIDEVLTPDSSRFWPKPRSRTPPGSGAAQSSTSSPCGTGSTPSPTGTRVRRRPT